MHIYGGEHINSQCVCSNTVMSFIHYRDSIKVSSLPVSLLPLGPTACMLLCHYHQKLLHALVLLHQILHFFGELIYLTGGGGGRGCTGGSVKGWNVEKEERMQNG